MRQKFLSKPLKGRNYSEDLDVIVILQRVLKELVCVFVCVLLNLAQILVNILVNLYLS